MGLCNVYPPAPSPHHQVELNMILLEHYDHTGVLLHTPELEAFHALMSDQRLSVLSPDGDVEVRIVLTAPHGVWLLRDGQPHHKPEDYTSFMVNDFAATLGAAAISWASTEISKSKRCSAPDVMNRDPNFLSTQETATNPWNRALVMRPIVLVIFIIVIIIEHNHLRTSLE
eukprot:TRINITY_DN6112_c0_g1_i20.p1 TRINITY_DN6112_c0_g1~~TRINITY_DN6112_c0_g1_i20.p1  ORF type:complete len:171 (-),score=10.36 TRINITY_DN6112_c0_g1_i20:182-694(-)